MNDKALEWHRQWETAINEEDFAAARRLFSPGVNSFGTLTGFMAGLQELETRQWRLVWPAIRNFKFDDPMILSIGEHSLSTFIVSLWHSKGKAVDGSWYDRKGRAAPVLRLETNFLRCSHSHLSMDPCTPPFWKSRRASKIQAERLAWYNSICALNTWSLTPPRIATRSPLRALRRQN